mgnify:CR=1 FL=1
MNKWIYTILLVGLLAISTSPVIARLLPMVPAAVIAFWRMAAASAMLWSYSSIRPQESLSTKNIRLVLAAGFLLAMHFVFWFGALKLTSIANTTILGIVAPAFTLLFERLWYKRKLSWITTTALLIILVGGIIVQGEDLGSINGTGLGNIMAILSAIFLGSVFIIGAKVRKSTPVITYTRMVYTVSAIVLLASSLVLDNPLTGYSINNYFWLFMFWLNKIPDQNKINLLNKGTTDALDPITLPYLTTENLTSEPPYVFPEIISLSDANFDDPYRLIGFTALSVDSEITFLTLFFKEAKIIFWAPITFVLMHSIGLYSAAGTCFSAAACIT